MVNIDAHRCLRSVTDHAEIMLDLDMASRPGPTKESHSTYLILEVIEIRLHVNALILKMRGRTRMAK